jgi:hypothetical protein
MCERGEERGSDRARKFAVKRPGDNILEELSSR